MDCRITTISKMKNTGKIIYSIALVLVTFSLQAQETFPDDTQDVPLNDYISLLVLSGIALAYWFLKKNN